MYQNELLQYMNNNKKTHSNSSTQYSPLAKKDLGSTLAGDLGAIFGSFATEFLRNERRLETLLLRLEPTVDAPEASSCVVESDLRDQ